MLWVQSYAVLYKIAGAPPPVPLALLLTVALGGFGMRLPVGLLISRMLIPPKLAAVLDHIRIQRIGLDLPPVVIGAASALAIRLAANSLLEAVRRELEDSLAIGTAAGRDQCGSSEFRSAGTSEESRNEIYR